MRGLPCRGRAQCHSGPYRLARHFLCARVLSRCGKLSMQVARVMALETPATQPHSHALLMRVQERRPRREAAVVPERPPHPALHRDGRLPAARVLPPGRHARVINNVIVC